LLTLDTPLVPNQVLHLTLLDILSNIPDSEHYNVLLSHP